MCRSQGIDGTVGGIGTVAWQLAWTFGQALLKSWIGLWNLESIQTGKQSLPQFQPTTFYDLCDPTTHADCEKISQIDANSASCTGTKPRRSSISQNCRIWTCDQWLPHFLGISDGDIPVMVRRYSSSDRRASCFASLNARNEYVFGDTGTDYKWATCPRTQRQKSRGLGGTRAYKRRHMDQMGLQWHGHCKLFAGRLLAGFKESPSGILC